MKGCDEEYDHLIKLKVNRSMFLASFNSWCAISLKGMEIIQFSGLCDFSACFFWTALGLKVKYVRRWRSNNKCGLTTNVIIPIAIFKNLYSTVGWVFWSNTQNKILPALPTWEELENLGFIAIDPGMGIRLCQVKAIMHDQFFLMNFAFVYGEGKTSLFACSWWVRWWNCSSVSQSIYKLQSFL